MEGGDVNLGNVKFLEMGEPSEVIGVLVRYNEGCLDEVLDYIDKEIKREIVSVKDKPYMTITLPCGERYVIRSRAEFPVCDVRCTCGDWSHYFVKHMIIDRKGVYGRGE